MGTVNTRANPTSVKIAPDIERCTLSQNKTKIVTQHLWKEYLERAEDIRHTELRKSTYALRRRTIERVFC